VAAWYKVLSTKTRVLFCATGFEPMIYLMPERFANAILVQSLVERWWDTTHTFNIVNREIPVNPHDFHYMTGLKCNGAHINLKVKSGT